MRLVSAVKLVNPALVELAADLDLNYYIFREKSTFPYYFQHLSF